MKAILDDPRTESVIETDITKFFASIDHSILLQQLRRHISDRHLIELVAKIISSGTAGIAGSTTVGLVQGNPLSVFLSNLYRHTADAFLANDPRVVDFVVYSDDIRIGVAGDVSVANAVLADLGQFFRVELKLTLAADKSYVRTSSEDVQFLGKTWSRSPTGFIGQRTNRSRLAAMSIGAVPATSTTEGNLSGVADTDSEFTSNLITDFQGFVGNLLEHPNGSPDVSGPEAKEVSSGSS